MKYDVINKSNNVNNYYDIQIITIILDNVITNSLNYSKANLITDRVELYNNEVIFNISYSGIGFTKKDLNNALNQFYKGILERTYSRKSGLGLYIKKFSNIHLGDLYISNDSSLKCSNVYFYIEPI